MLRTCLFVFSLLLTLTGCKKARHSGGENGAFVKEIRLPEENLARIQDSGELIIGTISGPETYYEHRGQGFGLQFALAENFAETLGVGVRVELANDTTLLLAWLEEGEIDLIALQLPQAICELEKFQQAGARNEAQGTSWAVSSQAPDLAQALEDWFGEGVEVHIEKLEKVRETKRKEVRHSLRAPYISKEKGIISTFDAHFKTAAATTGWDWRLIAAQAYRESGFDPNAVSWAGASGLMQLMPATADFVGLSRSQLFSPGENVAAAAKYILYLQKHFSNVSNAEERVKLVLAAYNAGPGHIDDAQALARKYGKDPYKWDDVSGFVLKLSEPRFYRDPVVKHGYMIGSETYDYVYSIVELWKEYGGDVKNFTRPASVRSLTPASFQAQTGERNSHKKNKYSKEQRILSSEELRQNLSEE